MTSLATFKDAPTFSDVQLRCPSVTEEDEPRIAALLADATAKVLSAMNAAGVDVDASNDVQAQIIKAVICQMVIRAVPSFDSPSLSAYSQTVGPFSENFTLANPSGDLYLTSQEKADLGITSARHGLFQIEVGGSTLFGEGS